MVPPGVRESHAAIADRFRPGWDARNPLTLSFLDPELERSYRSSVLEARRRRQRGAALGGAALFLALAITSPIVLELPVWPVSGLLGLLVVTNTANGILVGRARSIRTLDALGIGIQLSSGFLLLVLFVTVDILGRYGALALAARLQTFAPVGSVVLGERTRELLGASADVRPLGHPALKGKSVPVAVYELLRLTDAEQSS